MPALLAASPSYTGAVRRARPAAAQLLAQVLALLGCCISLHVGRHLPEEARSGTWPEMCRAAFPSPPLGHTSDGLFSFQEHTCFAFFPTLSLFINSKRREADTSLKILSVSRYGGV